MNFILSSLFGCFQERKIHSILLIGLDNSGKTALLNQIEASFTQPPYSHLPLVQTVGQNYKEIKTKYKELQIFDIGGSQQLRVLWPDYVISADSIFFVIDGGAKDRFEEASSELKKLLPTISQRHIPLIIIANKCDTIAFETMETIISVFKPLLNDLKNSSIFRVSAFTGEGVVECLSFAVHSTEMNQTNNKHIYCQSLKTNDYTGLFIYLYHFIKLFN